LEPPIKQGPPQEEEYWDGRGWTRAPASAKAGGEDGGGAPPRTRTFTLVVVIVLFAMLAGVVGLGAYLMSSSQNSGTQNAGLVQTSATPSSAPLSNATAGPTARPSPKPTPTRRPATVVAPPKLTATISGTYCPVAVVGQNSCWKGKLLNTGPRIGRLSMTFVTGGGYTNWFKTHSGAALSGFYTSPGCSLNVNTASIVCGAVPHGATVNVYLSADAIAAGTFHYAVKFADISYQPVEYIDQNPDGTHRVVSWYEAIRA
jgi:hypothetical protein